jgi:two-component system, chemotaxis family, protein-glutamate methylesterase/glutaminase
MVPFRDVIAIGGSAGGHRALQQLVSALPVDFPAALLIALHLPASQPSVLPEFLDSSGPLPARFAHGGELVRPGRIFVAPPDRHMLAAEDGRLMLRRGYPARGMRPAIDPLFRSVAVVFGGRSIGVLLTGLLRDGVAGLLALKRWGGITVVQSPGDAEFSDLPQNALENVEIDHVVTLAEMGELLRRLVGKRPPVSAGVSRGPSLRERRGNGDPGYRQPR